MMHSKIRTNFHSKLKRQTSEKTGLIVLFSNIGEYQIILWNVRCSFSLLQNVSGLFPKHVSLQHELFGKTILQPRFITLEILRWIP